MHGHQQRLVNNWRTIMNKNTLAKIMGWIGGILVAGTQTNAFGKYSGIAGAVGGLLVSMGIHKASDTSVTQPNG
jgi:hypothetical protein